MVALFPHFPLLLLLLTAHYPHAHAQPSKSNNNDDNAATGPNYSTNFNAATAILIIVIISAFFCLAFFSVYFQRCFRSRDLSSSVLPAGAGAVTASRRGARRGLDSAVLETFPTLPYSEAARLKLGTESLECAVCLSEFDDDETLRMLPKCCHVFHPECIDTWLESHVTCPVCRADLQEAEVGTTTTEGGTGSEECQEQQVQGGEDGGGSVFVDIDLDRMGRSHSMGHVRGRGDRYTLRLPEHVRREMVAAGSLRRSASVAVFGSRRRGRSLRVGALSERWTAGILARVSTWRRGEAEGSAILGMFNCMTGGGGGDEPSSSSSGVVGKV